MRVLLFRGADRTVLNYSNQDAFDVAIISTNTDLADIIKNFRQEDVGECTYTSLYALFTNFTEQGESMHVIITYAVINKFGQMQELTNGNYSDIKLHSLFHRTLSLSI